MIKTGIFIRNDDRLQSAIDYLYNNTDLRYIVFKDESFNNQNMHHKYNNTNLMFISHQEFKQLIDNGRVEGLDYIFSYYYQKKLDNNILNHPIKGCINFHPAPLPKYRGVGNYSKCILEELDYWGVSAHFMDDKYDNGSIIQVLKFYVDSSTETYIGLENKTYGYMYQLFCTIVDTAKINNIKIQDNLIDNNKTSYLTRDKINELKQIINMEDLELISRKIRAFWCPPFAGASIKINDKSYTLIDDNILKELSILYKEKYGGDNR